MEQNPSSMKMSKVGNQTNSQDPQAVNSRVFVGNLNTFQCSKTDVERMFQRYGRLAGISMHKGYAFVQFTNPFDARGACLGEDGRTVLGQTLDVNMVAEPKPHQTGRKRQNVAKTGNDWDYYYDSYYASAFNSPRLPPLKRPRLAPPTPRPNKPKTPAPQQVPSQVKTYSNPDILICGNCREMFTDLQELLDHKKEFCKLRFTCKCALINGSVKDTESMNDTKSEADVSSEVDKSAEGCGEETWLLCVQCKEGFQNAWDLMVHVQAAHMLNIYQLGSLKGSDEESRLSPQQCDDEDKASDEGGETRVEQPTSPEEYEMSRGEACIMGALSIEPTSSLVGMEVNKVNGELKVGHE